LSTDRLRAVFYLAQYLEKLFYLKGVFEMSKTNTKLKVILAQRELTQRDLAFGAGLPESTVSTAIRHGITTWDTRKAICDFLDVEESEIFSGRNY